MQSVVLNPLITSVVQQRKNNRSIWLEGSCFALQGYHVALRRRVIPLVVAPPSVPAAVAVHRGRRFALGGVRFCARGAVIPRDGGATFVIPRDGGATLWPSTPAKRRH